jgi:hypothetical protein
MRQRGVPPWACGEQRQFQAGACLAEQRTNSLVLGGRRGGKTNQGAGVCEFSEVGLPTPEARRRPGPACEPPPPAEVPLRSSLLARDRAQRRGPPSSCFRNTKGRRGFLVPSTSTETSLSHWKRRLRSGGNPATPRRKSGSLVSMKSGSFHWTSAVFPAQGCSVEAFGPGSRRSGLKKD